MIEDTSSRPLREWYEASPEPDKPAASPTWITPVRTRSPFTAVMKGISVYTKALMDEAAMSRSKSKYTLFPGVPEPPKDETVRERALRLKQQPHSMAQASDAFHFDHRGRRR